MQSKNMSGVSDLEKRLRAKPDEFELKNNEAARSEVWKHFSLVFEKGDNESVELIVLLCMQSLPWSIYVQIGGRKQLRDTKFIGPHQAVQRICFVWPNEITAMFAQ